MVKLRGSRESAVWPPKLAGVEVGGIGFPKSEFLFPLRIFGKMAPKCPTLSQFVCEFSMCVRVGPYARHYSCQSDITWR